MERLVSLDRAAGVVFEDCEAARVIPSYVGQRHTPGLYWAASGDRLVGYESHLEQQRLTLLDFDPDVTVFATQPLIFEGEDAEGHWLHVPDVFARRRDGSVLLVDVKPLRFQPAPGVERQRARTAAVCAELGWAYEMVGEPDPGLWATVSWLAGYRRPLNAGAALVGPLLALAGRPVAIGDLVAFQTAPELALPVVFHLMWHCRLHFDMARPLRETTRVWAPDGTGGITG
ncbi:TnsA-like heteromeric transposase endonuclease subunit [Kitasatospora kazusensis]